MSAASSYTEANVINALLRGVAFPLPPNTYVSLHTADPSDAGGDEVTTTAFPAYVRREAEQGEAIGSGWSEPLHRARRKERGVMLATIIKQPADHLNYDIDFGRWLPEGDAVTMAETAVDPDGELIIESVQITDRMVKVWASGPLGVRTAAPTRSP